MEKMLEIFERMIRSIKKQTNDVIMVTTLNGMIMPIILVANNNADNDIMNSNIKLL